MKEINSSKSFFEIGDKVVLRNTKLLSKLYKLICQTLMRSLPGMRHQTSNN